MLSQERDNLRRQVNDLRSTCEYQEARMEKDGAGGQPARPPWERRSLRKKRTDKKTEKAAASASSGSNLNKVRKTPVSSFLIGFLMCSGFCHNISMFFSSFFTLIEQGRV